jgi:tetratricopeptide (TPR) repeat protein
MMRAALHAAMNRPADARAAIAEAVKADGTLPGPHDVDGQLLERENKPAEARAAYEQAVVAGSTSFYTYYRLAALTWTPSAGTADYDKIEELSTHATSLNDAYAPAQDLLGNIRLRLRKPGGAVAPATRAIELRPDQPAQRLTLAEALFQLGEKARALKMAQLALAVSRTDDERRRAQSAIDRYSK